MNDYEHIYVMDEQLSYEPAAQDSIAGIAAARGVDPLEVVMDVMASDYTVAGFFQRLHRRS